MEQSIQIEQPVAEQICTRIGQRAEIVSEEFADMPIIDFKTFLAWQGAASADPQAEELARIECQKVAECFHKFGILIIRDPRVNMKDNEEYIDLMEDYFERTGELFYSGEKVDDIKPECHYQVGATPEFIEMARNHSEKLKELCLPPEDTPVSPLEPILDAKWRFMWKIGERYEGDQADFPQVVPQGFEDWEGKMNKWGDKLLEALNTVSEMAAIGMGIHKDTFKQKMKGGAHLLAPTGSDLEKFNQENSIFAGFHYDISFMTIHGKSRYPGLSVWTRNWKKKSVKIPEGCLFVQAGLSFEHITGGYVLAGFHEVVYNKATREAYEKRKANFERDGIIRKQWRVSSTMFCHFADKELMAPLPELAHLYTEEEAKQYPQITAYDLLMQELSATGMVGDQPARLTM